MNISYRLNKLRLKMSDMNLDAILISSPENRRYFSSFTGSFGNLLITHQDQFLVTDFRYVEQAEMQSSEFSIIRLSGGGFSWILDLLKKNSNINMGFEGNDLTVEQYSNLESILGDSSSFSGVKLVKTTSFLDLIRAVKDSQEIKILKKAIEITDDSFEEVSNSIEPGISEKEIAWELEKAMRVRGAESLAFDTIVAAGKNGSMAHHRAGDSAVFDLDFVVIDMGAKFQGYCADLTRRIFLGERNQKFNEIYKIVLLAQKQATHAVRSGMTGGEVDNIAREVISDAGFGENFGHGLGHGVGLAVHEYPRVGPKSKDILENGMVFTIEPGIYIPEWGGIRIEDVVVLDSDKAVVLSRSEKIKIS